MTEQKAKPDHRFKISLIGNTFVGKTCLANVFAGTGFSTNYISTIGTDFLIAYRRFEGKTIKLDIWDLSGSERFQSVIHMCVRGSHGVIIVYDVNDPTSLKASVELYKKLCEGTKYCVVLVGTKNDLENKIIPSDLEEVINELKIKSFLTSAKTGSNLEKIFETLMAMMLDSYKDLVRDPKAIILGRGKEPKSGFCCS
ncbi:MAG: Ras-like GTP-binding protein YPT1 [Hyperionvirus sp.]|uniref:Ras-like GTP-binding protein YPT1 n=1 Tax=Hyperionvirus sp. TaxID=2487770 RepID=A0A3G5A8Q2_9VIRU|nr:MAG: Ras-like GTP-binding protein YPT1 [Hyperionvirus sp.]